LHAFRGLDQNSSPAAVRHNGISEKTGINSLEMAKNVN
jgi:hypothetical protein